MRSYPPFKKDVEDILNIIKETHPEYKLLKDMKPLKKGILSETEIEVAVKAEMFKAVEKRLKRKPYTAEHGLDAFANLLWLAIVLFYMDELQNIITE